MQGKWCIAYKVKIMLYHHHYSTNSRHWVITDYHHHLNIRGHTYITSSQTPPGGVPSKDDSWWTGGGGGWTKGWRNLCMRTNETKLLKFLLYDIKKGKKSSIFAQILTFQWKYFEKIMFNGLLTVYFWKCMIQYADFDAYFTSDPI